MAVAPLSSETEPSALAPAVPSVRSYAVWFVIAVAVLLAAVIGSVAFGSRSVSLDDIISGVRGHHDTIEQAAVYKRVPRTVLAVIIGAALAVSGTVMQGVTRNPLADPGILGVNLGASLFVVTGITTFGLVSPSLYIWVAILGAGCTAVFVYVIGSLGRGRATPLKLALAGTATSVAGASFIRAISMTRNDVGGRIQSWLIGGVGGASTDRILQVLPFLLVGAGISLAMARGMNTLALGDEMAAGLGERVVRTRVLATIGAVTLCGASTAVAGPIGFVGLVVPHACRMLIGVDHRYLLPLAALIGASLLTISDVVGRMIARPAEISVGIITAVLGAPFFIHIVRRQKVREL